MQISYKIDPQTGALINSDTGEILNSKGKRLDQYGRELPDPTPLSPPVGYQKQPSMMEQMRSMIRSEALRMAAEHAGAETFEEAEDFDVGDDFDPTSPYEIGFDDPIPQSAGSPADERPAGPEPEPQAPSPSPEPQA